MDAPAVSLPAEGSGVGARTAVAAAPASVAIDEAVERMRTALTVKGATVATLRTYTVAVNEVAKGAGWLTVRDITLESVQAFLASRMRNDHGGRAWTPTTIRLKISALKAFGRTLKAPDLLGRDPLSDLEPPRRGKSVPKHPYTAAEARAQIRASIDRQKRDRRARGCAPVCQLFAFLTGFRHEELAHLRWGDLSLSGDLPGIKTRAWPGNKSKTEDWLPINSELRRVLFDYRLTVAHQPGDLVFPHVYTKSTWAMDREAAGLPHKDEDGRPYSCHASRASFHTWLAAATPDEGIRKRLLRHHDDLAEWTYTARSKAELAEVAERLPRLWPEDEGGNLRPDDVAGSGLNHGIPSPGDSGENITTALKALDTLLRSGNLSASHAHAHSHEQRDAAAGPGRENSARLLSRLCGGPGGLIGEPGSSIGAYNPNFLIGKDLRWFGGPGRGRRAVGIDPLPRRVRPHHDDDSADREHGGRAGSPAAAVRHV